MIENVDGEETMAEREYRAYSAGKGGDQDPDVLLDVPVVKVDKIHLKVEELDARVALKAKVLDLVNLTVGVDAHLGKLEIDIEGVEAQALVKVRLDHVVAIVDRVLTTIDRNPDLVKSLGRAVEDVGSGTRDALDQTGQAVENLGEGASGAVGELGEGAGQAVGDVGQGAGQAVGGAVGELSQKAEGLAGGVAGAGVEGAQGVGGPEAGPSGPKLARTAAKAVAKEIGSAATDEAKDLGVAATKKVRELGERRRQRRADKQHATEAAMRQAEDLSVDLDEVEGTGAGGRITVGDVKRAHRD
ncbi:MAG TPA: E3 binding domain-containing protein [Solirubrobacterales bacterium]|nr:E3 binding domain-containing protein [Solirubrobacterales bacterium]